MQNSLLYNNLKVTPTKQLRLSSLTLFVLYLFLFLGARNGYGQATIVTSSTGSVNFTDGNSVYVQYKNANNNYSLAKYNGNTLTIVPSPAGYEQDGRGFYLYNTTITNATSSFDDYLSLGVHYHYPRLTPTTVLNNCSFSDGTNMYLRYLGNDNNMDLAKYDGNTLTIIPSPAGYDGSAAGNQTSQPVMIGSTIYMAYRDNNNKMDLAKYDGNTLTIIPSPSGYEFDVNSVPTAISNTLYLKYKKNDFTSVLAKYDGNTLTIIPNPTGYNTVGGGCLNTYNWNGTLYALYKDNNGRYDIAKYDGTNLTMYPTPNTLPYGINGGNLTKMGSNLYASTATNELVKFDGTNYTVVNKPSGYENSNSGIVQFNAVIDNVLYMTLNNNNNVRNLAKYDGSTLTIVPNPSDYHNSGCGFMGNLIIKLGSNLYLGYRDNNYIGRLVKYDGTNLTITPHPNSTDFTDLNTGLGDILFADNSNIYLRYVVNTNTIPKLYKYDGTSISLVTMPNGLNGTNARLTATFLMNKGLIVGSNAYFHHADNDYYIHYLAKLSVCTPPTAYTLSSTSTTYCPGAAGVELTLSNSEVGVSYQLKNGGNNVGTAIAGTGAALSFGNQTAGSYTVEATKTSDGCTAIMTGNINLTANPNVVPTISIAANSGNAIFPGTTVIFDATISNGGATPSYQWYKNNNAVGTNAASYSDNTLANGDVIKCTLTSNAACATPTTVTSADITVSINSPFTFIWNTESLDRIYLTAISGYTYNYNLYWEEVNNPNNNGVLYNQTSGILITGLQTQTNYRVKITGEYPALVMHETQLREISQWGSIVWKKLNFSNASNLEITAQDVPDVSQLTNLNGTFELCTNLTGTTANWNWNTSNITEMINTFFVANKFNGDLSSWNTENVTVMSGMFSGAAMFNANISSWNTAKVTNMQGMFFAASKFNQNIGNWNTSKVTAINGMFQSASSFNQNIGNWNLSGITNMANFLTGTGMSCANYSNTLMGWAANPTTPSVAITLGANNLKYNQSANPSRNILTTKGWTILDAGLPNNENVTVQNLCASSILSVNVRPNVSYLWSNGATTNAISLSNTGSYIIVVTDDNGCASTGVGTAAPKAAPIAFDLTGNSSYCSDKAGTPIGLSGSSLGISYQLKKDGNNIGNAIIGTGSNLNFGNQTFGNYTVVATDSNNGCTNTMNGNKMIAVNPIPNANAGNDVTITCSNPSTILSASGGNSYIWNDEATQGGSVSPISTRTYTVIVKGANGCTATDDVIVTVDKNAPIANAGNDVTVTCSNPSTTLIATGGVAYVWNNGVTQGETISPSTTTNFTVTVTAANGCQAIDNVTVTARKAAPLVLFTHINSRCEEPNGSVTTYINFGQSPYSYLWSNGETTAKLNNISSGNYSVTVIDANGCVGSGSQQVTHSPKLTATIESFNNTTCGLINGKATAVGIGGFTNSTFPLYYLWSNGSTTATINNLSEGIYQVTISDIVPCQSIASVTINNSTGISINSVSSMNATCGNNNGQASVTISPSNVNASYLWSNGLTTASIAGLGEGNYKVTVTDLNACTAIGTTTITSTYPPNNNFMITGGGYYCSVNEAIGISNSQIGVNYQLLKDNSTLLNTIVAGTGTALSFGKQTDGSYSVVATNTASGCSLTTPTSVISALKTKSISLSNLSGCNNPNNSGTASDDYCTANVTVNFNYVPSSGYLTLSRGTTVIASKDVTELVNYTSWTFSGVQMAADGQDIYLTADFGDNCPVTSNNLGKAPAACSMTAVLRGSASICAGVSAAIAITITGGESPYTVVYTDGTNNTTITNYVNQASIVVSPLTTKTYSLVSVSDASVTTNGISGTAAITVDESLASINLATVPDNVTVDCNNIPTVATVTATSACTTVTLEENSTKGTDNTQCSFYNYTITRTWTATDKRGNIATASQLIVVKNNGVSSLSPVANITVTEPIIPTTLNLAPNNCMVINSITYTDTRVNGVPPPCFTYAYTLNRVWTIKDFCENSISMPQTISVRGIRLTCPSDKTINTNQDAITDYNSSTLLTASLGLIPAFSDNCSISMLRYEMSGATTLVGSGSVAGMVLQKGTTQIKYNLSHIGPDFCTFNITVKDSEAPKIIVAATTVVDGCTFADLAPSNYLPTAIDNCTANPTLEVLSDVAADVSGCASKAATLKYTKSLTRIWKATDENGNTTTAAQKFFLRDMVAPTATLATPVVFVGNSNIAYALSGLNNGSWDNCSPNNMLTFKGCIGTTCTSFQSTVTLTKTMIPTGLNQKDITVNVQVLDACNNASVKTTKITLKRPGTMANPNNGNNSSIDTQDTESNIPAEVSAVPTVQGEMKCYPTPFSEDLNIQYNLTENIASVVLKVYDNQGRLVKAMGQEAQMIGFYQVRWNLSDLANGMYHVCLELNGKCKKMERVIMMK